MSLFLEMTVRGEILSTGTGFAVMHDGAPYLITNRHNLSGRRSDTNELLSDQTGACPDSVRIWHSRPGIHVAWAATVEPLYDAEERPLWLEHPLLGRGVDVVALPLTELDEVEIRPYSLENGRYTPRVSVASDLSIIGFPFSIKAGGYFGVWMRGTVASEMAVQFDGKPCFLIDSRTRPGQSGSPVIHYSDGGPLQTLEGTIIGAGEQATLLGIYSGRIHRDSDLGIVWKVAAINEVVANGQRPLHNNL